MRDGAMAIHAIDLHRVARLAVEITVAMIVLPEMTVGTVHALFQMNVAELHRFLKFVLVVWRHHMAFRIQQIALAIALIDRAKHPAMAVKIGELRVLELLVELGAAGLFEERKILPQTALG